MHRLLLSTVALFASLPGSTALAQSGGLPYNRSIDPLSVRYEPATGGGYQVSANLVFSTDGAVVRDLSCSMTLMVNGAVVGEPASLPIEAAQAGRWGCSSDWCERVCRGGWCRNFDNWFCICINIRHGSNNDSASRVIMPTPPLHAGDVVTLALAAMPGALPEIEPGDDSVSMVIGLPPCRADLNGDGVVNSQDFFEFLTAFFAGAPLADINGDGAVTSQDFFDFLAAFFAGC